MAEAQTRPVAHNCSMRDDKRSIRLASSVIWSCLTFPFETWLLPRGAHTRMQREREGGGERERESVRKGEGEGQPYNLLPITHRIPHPFVPPW